MNDQSGGFLLISNMYNVLAMYIYKGAHRTSVCFITRGLVALVSRQLLNK